MPTLSRSEFIWMVSREICIERKSLSSVHLGIMALNLVRFTSVDILEGCF